MEELLHMTNERKTLLNEEILRFLYKNASFQGLEEIEQQQLLTRYKQDEKFIKIMEISISLQEMIQEVEATMPKMQDKDYLLSLAQQQRLLKERTVVEDNVYFVPFNEIKAGQSPMIVLLQQSATIKPYEVFCKGTIMPLFHLCATQKRDLIIIPFSETLEIPLHFKNGVLQLALFDRFLNEFKGNSAMIVPAIEQAFAIFAEDALCNGRDLIMITDNQFDDFQALAEEDYATRLESLDIEFSVIAMSEDNFELQPISFAQQVFFANE